MKSEEERIQWVQEYLKIDFDKRSEFQDIVELVARLCKKPVALITLLGENSNWLKVRYGVEVEVMPRETSFCKYAIQEDDLLIVADAADDDRFKNNPLVTEEPNIRFYAGSPLVLNNGIKLGTLCLFDTKPSKLTSDQQRILKMLARQATYLLELELGRKELEQQMAEKDAKNNALMRIAQLQSHQIRQPLTNIMGLVNLAKNGCEYIDNEWLQMMESATSDFDMRIKEVVAETIAAKDLRAIRFNKMVEEIDDYAILLLDKDGVVENWNKGAEKIKGYRAEEIIGKHFTVFYSKEDLDKNRPQKLLRQAEETGVARDEGWRIRKDGSRFWGSVVITAIHNDYRDVIGFTKVTRDLTDISHTREALAASEELYKYVLRQTEEAVRIGGWELNTESKILTWTIVTKRIHGVDAGYVPELESAINFYKEGYSRDTIKQAVELAITEGKPWDLELQIITKQGNEKWVRATGYSNYKDGVCTKIYGTFQDIDESKREKIDIARSQKLFDSILNAPLGIGIIGTSLDGTITVFNAGAEKILGYKADEVIGKHTPGVFLSIPEIIERGKELGVTVDGFESLLKIWDVAHPEIRTWTYLRKDGSKTLVPTIVTPLRDFDNSINGYLGVAIDPDERCSLYQKAHYM